MKVVIATPLYPPDIAEPAPYVKELAKRLSHEQSFDVTVVTYGHLPEKVPGVVIIAVNKLQPLIVRLTAYTFTLLKAAGNADVLYLQNGASVELPMGIVSRITRKPLIVRISDQAAHEHASRSALYGMIERFAFSRARKVIGDTPLERPEILPFQARPESAIAEYEASWSSHMSELVDTFVHA